MEVSMLEMAGSALLIMLDPMRLFFLACGVMVGLALGVIPGLGGIVGMALLLPFTFDMDAYSAFAFLLGMGSVTATSDVIPAILFGVPGTAGCAATILDGHPLAKQGQAGRALGAAYSASLVGGIFGALLLAVSVPILRPVMLYLGSPELLSFAIFGLSMVAVLSGGSPLRGLAAAGFGLMVAMIGSDPQTGTLRWTLDTLYLWDGMPLVPVTLGLFAIPELADLAIARRSIAEGAHADTRSGQWQGVKDTFNHWWLVIRVSWIGSALGAVPGIGAAVVDWIAYGHAARTEKGAAETFGKGDIRGVLASEGSNNAKEGGALVPTIAFGVPGSASMAILLGAFLIHGLVPGPSMLNQHLDVTYTMVWSVALANILGAGTCFLFSNQFAKIALIRHAVIMPLILTVVFIGAYQGSRQWGDLFALLFFGIVGWIMKRMGWPRPPVILGVVLGDIVERYLFISMGRYGTDWLWRPVVAVMLVISIIGILRPLLREFKSAGGVAGMFTKFSRPGFDIQTVFYFVFIALLGVMVYQATEWNFNAKIVPLIVGGSAMFFAIVSLLNYTFRKSSAGGAGEGVETNVKKSLHLDIAVDEKDLDPALVVKRAAAYLGWILGFMGVTALIGMLPTIAVFVIAYMRIEGHERWMLVSMCVIAMTAASWFIFDQLLSLPWPDSVLGDLFPTLKNIIPSV
jgi:TctA family transporter